MSNTESTQSDLSRESGSLAKKSSEPLAIDVWSDIACPWCFVGKRQLEEALDSFPHPVKLTWHSFELDPSAPKRFSEGPSYVERLARKYRIPTKQGQDMIDAMTARGTPLGIVFRFDVVQGCNTFDAHRLLHLSEQHGVQDACKEALLLAYMTEGRLISDHSTLLEVADRVGLDPDAVSSMLASSDFSDAVREDEAKAAELGINGVPFFVIANKYGVSGAQPAEVLQQILQKAYAETARSPLVQLDSVGEQCGDNGCAIE